MEIATGSRAAQAEIRRESRIRPDTGRLRRRLSHRMWRALAAAWLLVAALATAGLGVAMETIDSQTRSLHQLRVEVHSLQSDFDAQPNWSAVAYHVEPSVFTIETSYGLGSGWVARSSEAGSELVTNFHVIRDVWNAGDVVVDVRQGDQTIKGTISRVDPNDDLAIIHVAERLASLPTITTRPNLAQAVMVVGSPLGLAGSVSVGVISGFHSIEGSDFVQFSAPISPGNSGGPVVDSRGRVVAVASAKFEGPGVEALSLGIPVGIACSMVAVCLSGSN